MTRPLKVYTLGIHGFVGPTVRDALGLPDHIRQVQVNIVATTKAEAIRVAEAAGFYVSPRDTEFRVDGSPLALSLLAAFVEPVVLASAMVGSRGNGAVVAIEGRDQVRRVGSVGYDDRNMQTFIPEES